jgi:hypothetical protein
VSTEKSEEKKWISDVVIAWFGRGSYTCHREGPPRQQTKQQPTKQQAQRISPSFLMGADSAEENQSLELSIDASVPPSPLQHYEPELLVATSVRYHVRCKQLQCGTA